MIREPHQLGDAPIEREYREKMNHLAAVLDSYLNGEARGNDRETGFVLLVFPFGEKEGRCNYISNGADRKDIVAMMKEQIKRFEGQPDMRDAAALTKKPRDLTVARVDEHGVAYNSAGESIGMTGKTGHGCSGAVGEPERTEEEKPMNRKASMTTLDEARAKVIAIMEPKQPWEKLDPDLIEFGAKLLIAYERLAAETREPKP